MSDVRTLFDKIINVKLYSLTAAAISGGTAGSVQLGDGTTVYLTNTIDCPRTGRKPAINLRGKILPSPILAELELRIWNFIADVPLNAYRYVKIEAGYSGALDSTIEGEIVNAYQETPGPDGITVFQLQLGVFSSWNGVMASKSWIKGTSIASILSDCAGLMGMTVSSSLDASLVSQTAYAFSGLVSRFISDLAQALYVNIYPDGQVLRAYAKDQSTEKRHVMRFFKSPPRHDASGYNLVAPFDPTIRPGDVLVIDSRYMRQTYGGAQVANSSVLFVAQVITFDFSTVDDTNSMTILATEAS